MSLPPIAALFLTHFDDIKGQSVTFYESASANVLPEEGIEHKTLPSGLHTLTSDLVLCTHHGLPCVGLFRSREREDGAGRGRSMGTLGVVLAPPCTVESLFDLELPLADLYDQLEALPGSIFETDDKSPAKELLRSTWSTSRATSFSGQRFSPLDGVERIREFIDGKASSSRQHPVAHLPTLLDVLGPTIVTVYKAALSGSRILLYSPPPLLPLGAFAWCIWAMCLPPATAIDSEISSWIGHVGLMDLDEVKSLEGGWIATTSDAIYKNHTSAYDIFIDLSSASLSPSPSAPQSSQPPVQIFASQPPSTDPRPITYSFSDLPLYRSLLLLSSSPSSVTVGQRLSKSGGLWLLAFELLEKLWRLCVGVCEFAVGRGRVGEVRLDEGEEGDPLFGEYDDSPPELGTISTLSRAQRGMENGDESEDELENDVGEDEAIRRGRLVVRQFHHHTYHLYGRLRHLRRGDGGADLTEAEVRELCGVSRWTLFGGSPGTTQEGRWWISLARRWGITEED